MSPLARMAVWTLTRALLSVPILPAAALARGGDGPVFATLAPDDREFTRF